MTDELVSLRAQAEEAVARADWTPAVGLYAQIRQQFGDVPDGWIGGARALREVGQYEAAALLLDQGLLRFAGSADVLAELAALAAAQGQWDEAALRWQMVTVVAPERADGKAGLAACLEAAGKAAAEETPAEPVPVPLMPAAFWQQFVTLGSEGVFCAVQEHHGLRAEGLLARARISPTGLALMLEQRFAGLADPALNHLGSVSQTYQLHTSGYEMQRETFVLNSQDPADLLPKLCEQNQRLARELEAVLGTGERVLVYAAVAGISDAEALRIWRAVQAYGASPLLIVSVADAELSTGRLKILEQGVMRAALPALTWKNLQPEGWTALCLAAWEECQHWAAFRRGLAARVSPWLHA